MRRILLLLCMGLCPSCIGRLLCGRGRRYCSFHLSFDLIPQSEKASAVQEEVQQHHHLLHHHHHSSSSFSSFSPSFLSLELLKEELISLSMFFSLHKEED